MGTAWLGAGIIVGMALIYDTDGTIRLVTIALGIRGVTWLVKKITCGINMDAAQIIDFAGWSLAGISIVKILANAMASMAIIKDTVNNISDFINKLGTAIDKITF